jgi:predicted amidophosphoribosyltransferase
MDVLHKLKETPPQLGLSASKRLSNLKGAFQAKRSVQEKRLLLVDDVITTGATVAECAKQLLKAGARKVVVLSIARSSMM